MELLGEGSFGKVLLEGDRVAVKQTRKSDISYIITETVIMNMISHPCIAYALNTTVRETTIDIRMKRYDGNLFDWEALLGANYRGGEAIALFAECAFQLSAAIHYLHNAKIVHGDLKPENVLVKINRQNTTKFEFALCDFNISYCNLGARNTEIIQSLLFRAPEVNGSTPYSYAVDIYSLGCIFYEILTKCPFVNGLSNDSYKNVAMALRLYKSIGDVPPNVVWPTFSYIVKLVGARLSRAKYGVIKNVREELGNSTADKLIHLMSTMIAGCIDPTPQRRFTAQILVETCSKLRQVLFDTPAVSCVSVPRAVPITQNTIMLATEKQNLFADITKSIRIIDEANIRCIKARKPSIQKIPEQQAFSKIRRSLHSQKQFFISNLLADIICGEYREKTLEPLDPVNPSTIDLYMTALYIASGLIRDMDVQSIVCEYFKHINVLKWNGKMGEQKDPFELLDKWLFALVSTTNGRIIPNKFIK